MSDSSSKKLILLLRYSDFNGVNTIKEHIDVIENNGSCWWAKIGKTPSPAYIHKFSTLDQRVCFLYTPGKLFKCTVEDISYLRPIKDYPSYYDRDIFSNKIEHPSIFFKLSSIEPIELSVLDNYVVKSSGKPIKHDLKISISSYYLLQDKDEWVAPKKRPRKSKEADQTKVTVNSHYCIYQNNGICDNKNSINYSYKCERPNMCAKQKTEK